MDVDWRALVFEPGCQARLRRQALQRFGRDTLTEEAMTDALDALSRDDWAALQGYDGRAAPQTFLHVAFGNALEDFRRRRYGRRRPPVWVQRLGSLWECVFQWQCLEGLAAETIVERLCPAAAADALLTPDYVRDIARQLRGRIPDCGAHTGEIDLDPADPVLLEQPGTGAGPEAMLAEHELGTLLQALAGLLGAAISEPDTGALARHMHERRGALRAALRLDDEERLLLRLVFQDGLSTAAAARRLAQPEHTVRRRLRALLARLREGLAAVGLGADDILGMLRDRAG